MASRFRHLRARLLKTVFQVHAHIYEGSDGRIGAWIGAPFMGPHAATPNGGKISRRIHKLPYAKAATSSSHLAICRADHQPKVSTYN